MLRLDLLVSEGIALQLPSALCVADLSPPWLQQGRSGSSVVHCDRFPKPSVAPSSHRLRQAMGAVALLRTGQRLSGLLPPQLHVDPEASAL